MRVSILDLKCCATGLKDIFPEAEYYISPYNETIDKNKFFERYGFYYNDNYSEMFNNTYDLLIIIYNFETTPYLNLEKCMSYHKDIINLVMNKVSYKKVACFSYHDTWKDPFELCKDIKPDIWFKRNMQNDREYNSKVVPFPFLLFAMNGNMCPLYNILNNRKNYINKFNRLMWAGKLYNSNDIFWDSYCNREKIYEEIEKTLKDKNTPLVKLQLPYNEYMDEIAKSMFALDLNGAGDPNVRTLEILSCGTIMMRQKNNCIWPFEEGDCLPEITQFETANELADKLTILSTNNELYTSTLMRQQYIVDKYFNKEWLRNYILNKTKNTSKNIAFFVRHFTERGTEVSIYDYAKYNEEILNNTSYIICFSSKTIKKINFPTNRESFDKFNNRFKIIEIDDISQLESILDYYNISVFYTQTHGCLERLYDFANKQIWSRCKTIKHAVFDVNGKESDYYCSISNFLSNTNRNGDKIPVLPYIVTLPSSSENLRTNLNIPLDATVFGGYGGKESFDIKFVHNVIVKIAENYPNIYFLFANFNSFCPFHPNIIHVPAIIEPLEKTKFINTCDAMLWGRSGGETFGLAIAEFSINNKPVIATPIGELAHVELLGNKGIWYHNEDGLYYILSNFNKDENIKKDWNAYREYSPENVMKIFKNIVDNILDEP